MLQTGYLTLKESIGNNYYKASYPNKEVERAFERMLLKGYMYKQPSQMSETILDIQEAIETHDLERVIEILKHMFSILPSHFFKEGKETTDKQGNIKMVSHAVGESFYHAIIYLVFNILGVRMQVEVATQKGRIDAVVETNNYIYLFEFKVNRKSNVAIEQIINNNYANQFALSKKEIYLIGVGFNLRKKGISDYTITPFKHT
jgi:ATP-dependent exoDNAse (exonuclease V) beta subunit